MAIPPPPRPSLPKDAPWKEVEAVISGLLDVAARLGALLSSQGVTVIPGVTSPIIIPGAPGGAGGQGLPGAPGTPGVGLTVADLRASLALWTQPAAESGVATGGSTTTVTDVSKNWVVNQWAGTYIRVVKPDGTVYYGVISSNTAQQITFSPEFGIPVAGGDTYGVRGDPKALINIWPAVDIWSAPAAQIVVPAVAADLTLPSITVQGIPTGATIHRAVMFLKFRNAENTNPVDNSLSGAQNIQAQKAVGGTWTTGIALPTGLLAVPAATREQGDVILGTGDLSTQVPANDAVISFKWTAALAALASLELNDVQTGIRVYYSV